MLSVALFRLFLVYPWFTLGWSDWARLGSSDNAKKLAPLIGKMVLMSFADGIDLDFEHLTPFNSFTDDDEFAAFTSLITEIRTAFAQVRDQHRCVAAV